MQKIAHNETLTPTKCAEAAAFGFSVALASPTVGFSPSLVRKCAGEFMKRAAHNQKRHADLVVLLGAHLKAA